jgi:hypothetical protein
MPKGELRDLGGELRRIELVVMTTARRNRSAHQESVGGVEGQIARAMGGQVCAGISVEIVIAREMWVIEGDVGGETAVNERICALSWKNG